MKEKQIVLIDDLDGSPAVATVRFGVDGERFEIDLSNEHRRQLIKDLGKWTQWARKTR